MQAEGFSVTGKFSYLFNGIVIENISKEQAREIENIEGVKRVWENKIVEVLLEDSVPMIQGGIAAGKMDIYGDDCEETGKENRPYTKARPEPPCSPLRTPEHPDR